VSQRSRDACCNIAAVLLQRELASLQCSATARHRCSGGEARDVRRKLDFRLWDFCPSVLRPDVLPSYVLLSCAPIRPATLRPIVLRPAFSSNIYLTSVQYLCVTGYSQQRTLFFELYVVLEFCS
jgi:hypothetical protein